MGELAIGDRVELTWVERNGEPFPAFTRTPSAPDVR